MSYTAIIDEHEDAAVLRCGCLLTRWTEQDVIELNFCPTHHRAEAVADAAQSIILSHAADLYAECVGVAELEKALDGT